MTKRYKIKNTNILHNGELKKIGDVIELEDKEAEKLADILTEVKETPAKPSEKADNPSPSVAAKTAKTAKATKAIVKPKAETKKEAEVKEGEIPQTPPTETVEGTEINGEEAKDGGAE